MLAQIGIMRALNCHVERVFEPSGKKHHWGSGSSSGMNNDSPTQRVNPNNSFQLSIKFYRVG